jgi:hypothetical protein
LIFPTDFVEIDNGKGCIAVINKAGRARKEKQRAEMMGNSRHPKAGK